MVSGECTWILWLLFVTKGERVGAHNASRATAGAGGLHWRCVRGREAAGFCSRPYHHHHHLLLLNNRLLFFPTSPARLYYANHHRRRLPIPPRSWFVLPPALWKVRISPLCTHRTLKSWKLSPLAAAANIILIAFSVFVLLQGSVG